MAGRSLRPSAATASLLAVAGAVVMPLASGPAALAGNGAAGAGDPPVAITPLVPGPLSCAQAQASVQRDLAAAGAYVPWLADPGTAAARRIQPSTHLERDVLGRSYVGAPAGRPLSLAIQLSGNPDRLYQGVLSSPVLLSKLGARILAACPTIGLVSFHHWHEGGVPVGYFSDGTARTFTWTDPGDRRHTVQRTGADGVTEIRFLWGHYFSP